MQSPDTGASRTGGNTDIERSRDTVREEIRLRGCNINPESLLATDYLNHFNEIIMLLDLAAEMPDCFEDAAAWQPLSYREHFLGSNLAYRELAIEAHEHCPEDIRECFDGTVRELDERLMDGIEQCLTLLETQGADPFRLACRTLASDTRGYIDRLSAIIHGTDGHVPPHSGLESETLEDAQHTIDSLFEH